MMLQHSLLYCNLFGFFWNGSFALKFVCFPFQTIPRLRTVLKFERKHSIPKLGANIAIYMTIRHSKARFSSTLTVTVSFVFCWNLHIWGDLHRIETKNKMLLLDHFRMFLRFFIQDQGINSVSFGPFYYSVFWYINVWSIIIKSLLSLIDSFMTSHG